ncbi:MAG TPA: LAGLIDADG family homing endonuclease [Actinomycetota bacterium]
MSHFEEAAWAAGFFDAEGSTALIQGRYPMITVAQVGRDLLDRFRVAVGDVGSVVGPYPPRAGTYARNPQHVYVCYKESESVAEATWPFLGGQKRARIAALFPNRTWPERALTRRESLAWAAGFFDGDGCFSAASARIATITQVDREVLERFQATVGFGTIYGPYENSGARRETRQPFSFWRTNRFEHTQALAAMLWFKLGEAKKQQAIATLSGSELCKRGHVKRKRSGCPRCVAEAWERKRALGQCRKGHDKGGLPSCPTCASDGNVREAAPVYAA